MIEFIFFLGQVVPVLAVVLIQKLLVLSLNRRRMLTTSRRGATNILVTLRVNSCATESYMNNLPFSPNLLFAANCRVLITIFTRIHTTLNPV